MNKTSIDLKKGDLARYTKDEHTYLVTLRSSPDARGMVMMRLNVGGAFRWGHSDNLTFEGRSCCQRECGRTGFYLVGELAFCSAHGDEAKLAQAAAAAAFDRKVGVTKRERGFRL